MSETVVTDEERQLRAHLVLATSETEVELIEQKLDVLRKQRRE